MAAVQLVLEDPQLAAVSAPRATRCPCGSDTLLVRIAGVAVILNRGEVLEPYPCTLCAQVEAKGHTRGACWRCGGTRWLGGQLPRHGVAIDESGDARRFYGAHERPQQGDAVHALHVCAPAHALAA